MEIQISILQFGATRCGPCKMIKPILENISKERGYSFTMIDIDEDELLTQDSGIMSVPTVLILVNGLEEVRFSGVKSKEDILSIIDSL